ncbi:MAG: hypothetical protein UW95_C0013G0004 [Parcubacteria group bacterium GW2011_GWC1_45_14]|nr:MAG: hypothetical protein UW87_C0030G0003 [Candidatus Moranbacteria bacterium GW2011_GWC2_45_10]KKT94540.1 MAG: hypothetical protein UW95_C0013G0004 [Parcubacteria group bacterium GW2011_GWC1_45_14]
MNQAAKKQDPVIISMGKEEISMAIPHTGKALCVDLATYHPDLPNQISTSVNLSQVHHYFDGHFPNKAILPAHWQIEMIALSAAILMKLRFPEFEGFPVATSFGDSQKFSKPIFPPQQIEILTSLTQQKKIRGSIFAYFDSKIYLENGTLATRVTNLSGSLMPER